MAAVLSHNERAAVTWGSGRRDYDRISEGVSDALAHLVNRIDPQQGERFLDVATGTGWTARAALITWRDNDRRRYWSRCNRGRKDAGPGDCLSGCRRRGEESSFDAVTSTFGVMFVAQPEIAAREMARVCRTRGRLGLLTWVPEGVVPAFSKPCGPTCRRRQQSAPFSIRMGSSGANF
jgi:ubiquinone/menaquinone biosynthesis C-methylase UbiE